MKRFDYNFSEYQEQFYKTASKILTESYCESFDAEEISDQIDEAQVTYNKIQKILNAPEMIKSHAYLYALDMENVDECDKKKIDKLYELGKARGVICEDDVETSDETSDETNDESFEDCDDVCGGPSDALTGQEMTPAHMGKSSMSTSFTILYSAMKDGQVKTGEYFSSATDGETAKADCIDNLNNLGYSSIRILGMEQTNASIDTEMIDEDDSEEYENQETGAAETDNKDEEKSAEDADKEPNETEQKDDDKSAESDKKEDEQKTDDVETKDSGEDNEDDKKDKESDEDKEEKLTPTEKQLLKDEYIAMFKSELQKTKLQKSVDEMTIKEKADFWGNIAKNWTKQDPEEFMPDKDIEKLNKTVIKTN